VVMMNFFIIDFKLNYFSTTPYPLQLVGVLTFLLTKKLAIEKEYSLIISLKGSVLC